MRLFERTLAARTWTDEERMILDAVQRVVDDVIAPNAARLDAEGAFVTACSTGLSTSHGG